MNIYKASKAAAFTMQSIIKSTYFIYLGFLRE